MTNMDPTGGGKSPLSLVIWGLLVTVFVAAAYLGGSALARQWILPPLAPPVSPTAAPEQVTASAAASAVIEPGVPIESTLDAETEDELGPDQDHVSLGIDPR